MGVDTKETPFEIAEVSDVIITMLPSSSHVSFCCIHRGIPLLETIYVDYRSY